MVVIVSLIFIRQFSSRLSRKHSVLGFLWNKFTRFFPNRFLKGITREEESDVGLPEELWEVIGKRLKSRLEIANFRSVCKIFRRCVAAPTLFPLRVPPLPNWTDLYDDPSFSFIVTQLESYQVESESESEHVGVEEILRGHFRTYGNPLFRRQRPPPSWWRWKQPLILPDPIRQLLVSKLSFCSMAHHLRVIAPRPLPLLRLPFRRPEWAAYSTSEFAKKTVVISSSSNPDDVSVVVHMSCGRLALLRLGVGRSFQDWDTEFCTQVFHLIATFEGRLCVMDELGRVLVMDYESFKMNQLTPPSPGALTPMLYYGQPLDKHLFEAFGNLYLVMGEGVYGSHVLLKEKIRSYMIFRFSFQRHHWVRVHNRLQVVHALYPQRLIKH